MGLNFIVDIVFKLNVFRFYMLTNRSIFDINTVRSSFSGINLLPRIKIREFHLNIKGTGLGNLWFISGYTNFFKSNFRLSLVLKIA